MHCKLSLAPDAANHSDACLHPPAILFLPNASICSLNSIIVNVALGQASRKLGICSQGQIPPKESLGHEGWSFLLPQERTHSRCRSRAGNGGYWLCRCVQSHRRSRGMTSIRKPGMSPCFGENLAFHFSDISAVLRIIRYGRSLDSILAQLVHVQTYRMAIVNL